MIGELVGVSGVHSDIEPCNRVPSRIEGNSKIVFGFQSRQKRVPFLEKARKRPFFTADLCFSSASPVYINEHLCPALKRLLRMAVSRKREFDWKCV